MKLKSLFSVERQIPYDVPHHVPVEIPIETPVSIPVPYEIYVPVEVEVEVPYAVPVNVEIPVPVPYEVQKQMEHQVPIEVLIEIPVEVVEPYIGVKRVDYRTIFQPGMKIGGGFVAGGIPFGSNYPKVMEDYFHDGGFYPDVSNVIR